MKAQYAILRFAKYKGPEIGHIEAHNERTKEKYASNPDVDTSCSHLNFHLVTPERKYRAEAEKQIAEAGCRTRSDSVRVVEALVTASPEFFKGKKRSEVKSYFTEALDFIQKHQSKDTIISAVVHMDEKTPHMHLCFVPLTEDKRLSAKEIVGNKKKLTWWQDEFWKHMVKKYPDLERGERASETGRTHIPPRLFKEAVHLNRMKGQIMAILNDSNPFNKKVKAEELEALLDKYIPGVEVMRTKLKKYDKTYKELTAENAELEKKLSSASKESVRKKLEISQKLNELDELRRTVDAIPDEVIRAYSAQRNAHHSRMKQEI
ncbi:MULTISPECIES: MobV family relaxase [Oscillospiraceae]|uniref:MobV family relaxase n=1 Tax=Oscillospiraceae TaxID=216572 RepID=UPI00258419D7|nr:MobV family relaxase [Lawsonibacter sp.]MCI6398746.1 plasmid recombination protein [Lawsonibacter sp.]